MLKIEDPSLFRRQLLESNPFTLSHKDLVELEVREYQVIVDNHNGWKFIREGRNQLALELVAENDEEIYLSSKRIKDIALNYYESELMALVLQLVCRVEFRLRGVVGEQREAEFVVGWLPLPLDLALRDTRVELMLVNDLHFPHPTPCLLGVPCTLAATFAHPLHHKYRPRHEEAKIFAERLLQDPLAGVSVSRKYPRMQSQKLATGTLSSEYEAGQQEAVERQIRGIVESV